MSDKFDKIDNKNVKSNFFSAFIPSKNDNKNEKIRKTITLISAVVFIIAVILLSAYLVDLSKTKRLNDQLAAEHDVTTPTTYTVITEPPVTTVPDETQTTVVTTEPPPLVVLGSMESLLADNPDTAGWLTVAGTNINNVIVQAADNEYYLDRNFYGNKSQAGTIYADFRCVVNDYNNKQSDNIILYGHNQADGTMFGTLKKYKVTQQNTRNFQFYADHPTFTFSNLYEEYTYKIIAMFIIEVETYQNPNGIIFDYHNYIKFSSKNRTFDSFKENVLSRTAIDTGVDFEKGDKFITLSTCSNEFDQSRFVVIGRRVREGEDPNVDTSLAVLNTDAVEPDLNFIYSR